MNKNEIFSLLNIGENCEIEFKEAKNKLPKSIWSTYSAFANTRGGKIILGIKEIDNNFVIEGVQDVINIIKEFWNTINNSEKVSVNILNDNNVKVINVDDKEIVVISVPMGNRKQKPIYINNNPFNGTYKRIYDGDYKCKESEVKSMISDSMEGSEDSIILENYDINNINLDTLRDYRLFFKLHNGDNHRLNILSDEEFLYVLNALDRETKKLTLAGLVMFGNFWDIQDVLPNYHLDYREIKNDNLYGFSRWRYRITSYDTKWSGNLWDFFCKIEPQLTSDIPTPFQVDEKMMRIDNTATHISVREAIVNTLVHAQFSSSGSIVIEKGENYFKFSNPGLMRVKIDEVLKGGNSDTRNPILHKMFSYLGYGERAGSGLLMINNTWKDRKWILPEIEQDYNLNRTTLNLIMKEEEIGGDLIVMEEPSYYNVSDFVKEINKIESKILNMITYNSRITIYELSLYLNVSKEEVRYNINKLKEKNIIKRQGNSRNGIWIIQDTPIKINIF